MIALDSSVLIRYLTGDEPSLALAAAKLIEGKETVAVSSMALLESIHVLRGRAYGHGNPELADAIVELLQHENVVLTDLDGDLASAAIAGVRHLSPRHLADALIAAAAQQAGAHRLVTNDRKFASRLLPVEQLAGR